MSKNPFEPHSSSYEHWQDGYENPDAPSPYEFECQPEDCFFKGQNVRKLELRATPYIDIIDKLVGRAWCDIVAYNMVQQIYSGVDPAKVIDQVLFTLLDDRPDSVRDAIKAKMYEEKK